ncbi:MAG: hypothetical protein H6739_15190 [Alphaproteobacteria bacterium]|nr:hypothetical protein [Alphaproteobacteria bacterium]
MRHLKSTLHGLRALLVGAMTAVVISDVVFRDVHQQGILEASAAEAALRQGDLAPFAALMASWSWSQDPALVEAAARLVADATAEPPPGLLEPLPASDLGEQAEHAHRRRAWATARQDGVVSSPGPWVLQELAAWGRTLSRWRNLPSATPNPEEDRAAERAWASLLTADPFGALDDLQRRLLPPVMAQFNALMRRRRVPETEASRVRAELEEGFIFTLLDDAWGVEPRLDLALRVLESAGPGWLPLADMLTPAEAREAACCLAERRRWGPTLRAVWPLARTRADRASRLGERLSVDPGWLAPLTDLHLCARLLERWRVKDPLATHPDHGARILQQNLSRVRARLRAVLSRSPERLLEPLMTVEALDERTRSAAARFAWAWARRELPHHFTLGSAKGTRRCEPVEELPPLPVEADGPLRTWVLLAVLRGKDEHLERWVRTGGTGDGDSGWGRVLQQLPDALRDADGATHAMRRALAVELPEIYTELEPLLFDLADQPVDRSLRSRVETLLRPGWDDAIPVPSGGFRKMPARARAHLIRRGVMEEEP